VNDIMNLAALSYQDLLYLLMTDQVTPRQIAAALTTGEVEEFEDYAMAMVATITAGGDHMVHWEASEAIH